MIADQLSQKEQQKAKNGANFGALEESFGQA
jgi:hypothetical protein